MTSLLLSLVLASLSGGLACPADHLEESTTIYVVKHAWHAGIAIPWEKMEEYNYPPLASFEEGAYVEVGWGDAQYYPAPEPGIGTTIKAGLWPTPSTLHVAVLDSNPEVYFPQTEVLRFSVSEQSLQRLIRYISEAHELENGQAIPSREGLYGRGQFFDGYERYHVFNNCNHWVARALEQAACDVNSSRSLTVEQLLGQIRRFAD